MTLVAVIVPFGAARSLATNTEVPPLKLLFHLSFPPGTVPGIVDGNAQLVIASR